MVAQMLGESGMEMSKKMSYGPKMVILRMFKSRFVMTSWRLPGAVVSADCSTVGQWRTQRDGSGS